jgi:hypothetical protein
MSSLKTVETKLEGMFKGAPALPADAKDWLVKAWPWLALVFGVLQLAAAWGLYRLTTYTNELTVYINQVSRSLGGQDVGLTSTDKTIIYVGIAVLLVDAVILLMAYPHLVKRARRGWDLLFLGSLLNVVYSLVSVFIDGRGFSNLLFSLVGSAIGFYLLFQIKDRYKTHAA